MLITQKIVRLTTAQLLEEFKDYLKSINAELPLRLITFLSKHTNYKLDTEDICKFIYGNATSKDKRNLFQLNHHTLKLSGYISKNYPSFLLANFIELENLINKGKKESANELATIIFDVAEKIEDFDSQIKVLKFLAQQAFILENKNDTLKYIKKLEDVQEKQKQLLEIYSYIKQHFNFKIKKTIVESEIDKHLSFFEKYKNNSSLSISILAKYGYCYALNYLNDPRFYSDKVLKHIEDLIKEQKNHYYLIQHFADDILMNTEYLMLKHFLAHNKEKELRKLSYNMISYRSNMLFWNSYINNPLIINLSIQASYFISRYGFPYKNNAQELIPKNVKEEIIILKKTCEELLEKSNSRIEGMHVRYINLCTIYSCFLLLSSKNDIKKAINLLEGLLVSYQQITFHKLYDAIFSVLIMAYFALKDYIKVNECFKRYEKLTANTIKNKENDLSIKTIYYSAQWIENNRKQYVDKLNKIFLDAQKLNLSQTLSLINDITKYYKIPINFKKN